MDCCGIEINKVDDDSYRIIELESTKTYLDRKIYIGTCKNENCKALVAELLQYNRYNQTYERVRPKRKFIAEWIKQLEKGAYKEAEEEVEFGTHANMNWVNGVNTVEIRDGKRYIQQWSEDFNNVRTLVKEFEQKLKKKLKKKVKK